MQLHHRLVLSGQTWTNMNCVQQWWQGTSNMNAECELDQGAEGASHGCPTMCT